jgi:hypothetical protein
VSRQRLLSWLLAQRAEMIDHEIRDAATHAPHRRVVELEIRAEGGVGHGVESYPARSERVTNGQWNP